MLSRKSIAEFTDSEGEFVMNIETNRLEIKHVQLNSWFSNYQKSFDDCKFTGVIFFKNSLNNVEDKDDTLLKKKVKRDEQVKSLKGMELSGSKRIFRFDLRNNNIFEVSFCTGTIAISNLGKIPPFYLNLTAQSIFSREKDIFWIKNVEICTSGWSGPIELFSGDLDELEDKIAYLPINVTV